VGPSTEIARYATASFQSQRKEEKMEPLGTSGFHAFRHSVSSLINAETGNPKLAQKLLGHSNINMTADVYTHTSQESEREAARAVERAIYGDLFPICSSNENENRTAAIN
jgi:integrase